MKRLDDIFIVLKVNMAIHTSLVTKLCTVLTDTSCTTPIFFARTPNETSIIMSATKYDEIGLSLETGVLLQNDWICFMVIGPMPFDLVGILAKISNVLADASISLLAQSTYDTDYIFINHRYESAAKKALISAGIDFLP